MMKKEKKTENKIGQKGKTRRWGKRRKRGERKDGGNEGRERE